jgi:hypothetical protein
MDGRRYLLVIQNDESSIIIPRAGSRWYPHTNGFFGSSLTFFSFSSRTNKPNKRKGDERGEPFGCCVVVVLLPYELIQYQVETAIQQHNFQYRMMTTTTTMNRIVLTLWWWVLISAASTDVHAVAVRRGCVDNRGIQILLL